MFFRTGRQKKKNLGHIQIATICNSQFEIWITSCSPSLSLSPSLSWFLPFHPAFFATVCVSCLKILSPLLQKRRRSASSSNIYFGRDWKIFKYSNVNFTDNRRIQSWLKHWLMTVCNQHFSEEVITSVTVLPPPPSSPFSLALSHVSHMQDRGKCTWLILLISFRVPPPCHYTVFLTPVSYLVLLL